MALSYPSRLELILLMASGTLTDIISEAYDASTAEVFTGLQLRAPTFPSPLGRGRATFMKYQLKYHNANLSRKRLLP